jgi:putative phosphoribosyl transferase
MFKNRQDAGNQLAKKIIAPTEGCVVVGIARGGVVVAAEISRKLKAPLVALVVKKIPSPGNPELGIGAVASDNIVFVDFKSAQLIGADTAYIESQIKLLAGEIKKTQQNYIKFESKRNVSGKTVIIVDDGVANGNTINVAIKWLRKKNAAKIILALPVATAAFINKIRHDVETVYVLDNPQDFEAVGQFYQDFSVVTQTEVVDILRRQV